MKHQGNNGLLRVVATHLLLSLFLFQSCAQLSELSNISKPKVSISDMNVTGLSLQSVELTADVEIDNPNNVTIDLNSYKYALDINDVNFISGNEESGMDIKSKESNIVKVPITLDYSELLQTFQSLRDENESNFNFTADFTFDLPMLGMVNVPVQYSGKIPVVKRPSVSLENFIVENISLSGAELSIELNIDNPNSFMLQMDQLSYDLRINGLESISGSLNEEINVEEGSSTKIKLPVSISFLNAGMSAYRILTGNEDLEYELTGSTTIGSDLPYFKLSNFDFDKSGSVNILR